MNSARSNLKRLRAACHGAGLAVVVLCLGAGYFGIGGPIASERASHLARIEQLEQLLRTSSQTKHQHAQLKSQLADLEAKAESVRRRVPETAEEAVFLGRIAEIASQVDLHIADYQRGRVVRQPTHSQIEIGLKCEGTYQSICDFLDAIEQMPRVSSTKTAAITADKRFERLPFQLVLVLYYGMQDAPQAVQEASHG